MILFLFMSSFNLRKLLIFPIIVSLIIFSVIISKSDKIKNRMINSTINQLGLSEKSERIVLFSKTYEGHYFIALNMFKEKPIFGHGPKMFRFYCSKEENFVADNACTTHPHNFYAQLLAETGIIGFLFLLSALAYVIYTALRQFKSIILRQKRPLTDYQVCLLAGILVTVWPLTTNGNFFNNWLMVIYSLPVGFYLQSFYGKNK